MSLLEIYKNELDINNMPNFFNEFCNTPSLTRLKGIDYFCGMKYASPNLDIYKFRENPTRYDHSVTTALITWKLTKDMKQTIAALYHDVATPCFSHVIDYMNEDYVNQESTEKYTEKIINSDFILFKMCDYYDIKLDDIINYKNYSVVDTNRPKLCADRLDGLITTGISWTKSLNKNNIKKIVNNIHLYKNEDNEDEIGFDNEEAANLAYLTSKLINDYTHTKEDTYMMMLLAKITKLLIKKNIVKYSDLYYLTEDALVSKIKNSNDEEILDLFNLFQTIKQEDIIINDFPKIKDMNLNPLVKTKGLNK